MIASSVVTSLVIKFNKIGTSSLINNYYNIINTKYLFRKWFLLEFPVYIEPLILNPKCTNYSSFRVPGKSFPQK